jgi:hypothetical protein
MCPISHVRDLFCALHRKAPVIKPQAEEGGLGNASAAKCLTRTCFWGGVHVDTSSILYAADARHMLKSRVAVGGGRR